MVGLYWEAMRLVLFLLSCAPSPCLLTYLYRGSLTPPIYVVDFATRTPYLPAPRLSGSFGGAATYAGTFVGSPLPPHHFTTGLPRYRSACFVLNVPALTYLDIALAALLHTTDFILWLTFLPAVAHTAHATAPSPPKPRWLRLATLLPCWPATWFRLCTASPCGMTVLEPPLISCLDILRTLALHAYCFLIRIFLSRHSTRAVSGGCAWHPPAFPRVPQRG